MFGLYVSLALLGLSAVDPVGIGIMPVLLVRTSPYRRSFVFLGGSFASLMIMGVLFAKGLGGVILRFEHRDRWFVPGVELFAAVILLIVALMAYLKLRAGKADIGPSAGMRSWLQLGGWQLFLLGVALVAVQSILDVVFVIAMIRTGQFRLSDWQLVAGVATYAVTALILQLAVIIAFRFTPGRQRASLLAKVQDLLAGYSYQAVIVISLGLSCLLFALAA